MSGIMKIFLLLSWAQVTGCSHLLPPTDFRISVAALGKVELSWKPSVTPKDGFKRMEYMVEIQIPGEKEEMYYTKYTSSSQMLPLHKGLNAQLAAVLYQGDQEILRSDLVTAVLPPSSGAEGTRAKHLSCYLRTEEPLHVSLSCNWTAGKRAPPDTQYFMYYRYEEWTKACKEYVTEVGTLRHISCRVPSSYIDLQEGEKFIVLINGSSKNLEIQSLEQMFSPEEIEIINPPHNLSVMELEGKQILCWEKPLSPLPDDCFQYEVKIQDLRSGNERTMRVWDTKWENGLLQESWSQMSLEVRSVGTNKCRKNELFSAWSKIIHIRTSREDSVETTYVIAVTVCLTVAGLVLFLLCVRTTYITRCGPVMK
ncbi:interleukin-5 receptor subunit alpha isoform X2 [Bombina bombina]|uniref:interleukin-5 receptor subunit alpha isoform X2 n=1 Tax=Bombina bombina TaxID=8345 RepID=UPI00235AE250|nr:interleukin-5 receptor subunit alpha isoform X2 [Bombina bombina]